MKRLMLLSLAAAAAGAVQAATSLYDTGFENPFVPGALNNQQSWLVQGDPYTVTTDSLFVRSGAQGVSFNGVTAAATSWGWVDLLHTPLPAEPVIQGTVYVYIETDPENRGTTSAFGLDAYALVPTFSRVAAVRLRADGLVAVLQAGAIVGTTTTALGAPDQWNRIDLVLNYATNTARALVNGVDTGFSVTIPAGADMSDIDLYSVPLAFHRAGYDDYSVVARRRGVGLRVASASLPSVKGATATVTYRQAGADVFSTSAVVSENGFALYEGPVLDGAYDVVVKVKGHLAKAVGNATLAASDVVLTDVTTLTAGDIDNDNSITVFDYDKLSTYFDKTSADADWNTADGDGIAPADADLDGDGAVTVFDYDILSTNFDQVGD